MIIVVFVLGALVLLLAKNAPGPNGANQAGQSLPPDNSIAATGTTGVPSPASAGGSPLIASSNQLRLNMSYMNATDDKINYTNAPTRKWRSLQQGTSDSPNYLTDAQSSLMTQDVPALTRNVPKDDGGFKI